MLYYKRWELAARLGILNTSMYKNLHQCCKEFAQIDDLPIHRLFSGIISSIINMVNHEFVLDLSLCVLGKRGHCKRSQFSS